jgi:hypothetical protein
MEARGGTQVTRVDADFQHRGINLFPDKMQEARIALTRR